MRFDIPYTGDEREVRKFAWYPMFIDGCWYWLEWVTVHQSYNTKYPGWNTDWVVD
jgi:hypothetical protein